MSLKTIFSPLAVASRTVGLASCLGSTVELTLVAGDVDEPALNV